MSISSLPRTVGRTGLAATAAAFLAFGLAAPAAADPAETYDGAVRGKYIGNAENGADVRMTGETIGTRLFNLELEDGTVLTTYCIDFETQIRGGAFYNEDDWANYPGKGEFAAPAKVHWILQNAYPALSAEELGAAAGVEGLSQRDALGATQAAIWHFSNGVDLEDEGNSQAVRTVYTYLIENAEELPQTAEPAPALSITPGTASGTAGETVGEFLIQTNASSIPVDLQAPEGVQLVDLETGETVTEVGNGDTVGFAVPADAEAGQASFSLEASATVATGRLFKGDEESQPTQTLITAEGGETSVSASASADWTVGGGETPPESPEPSEPESPEPSEPESPEPTPSDKPSEPADKPSEPADDQNEPTLPVTGGALAGLVAAGVAALGAGGGAIYLSRKRKAANSQDLEG
ncbi:MULTISPECIES: thioester domain-containing protein [Nocardiopsis]|uniref:LPXTG-motif cell wall anchor domain protein n=2 Tax=Nocardiopsis TaxID=2013 RepID=D7AU59_NOCDD|nr:thioester domain-containing protein [Nocardiopsis dassonvillei]ADH65617.1 LPXTG-motif cell wall anchor domain protein [Nocardiopsis dassonvillei subsp. dassonvillei DSM 43111]APC33975.1 peptidase [Nocardiopsis dassonvillei]NKY79424.1 Cys-Gln thioester bond-forming surface protein [Nocardiopsis dassonvillei]VEI91635.1 TQXA domain [Nocardiopsis dassonvillei]